MKMIELNETHIESLKEELVNAGEALLEARKMLANTTKEGLESNEVWMAVCWNRMEFIHSELKRLGFKA